MNISSRTILGDRLGMAREPGQVRTSCRDVCEAGSIHPSWLEGSDLSAAVVRWSRLEDGEGKEVGRRKAD